MEIHCAMFEGVHTAPYMFIITFSITDSLMCTVNSVTVSCEYQHFLGMNELSTSLH